MQDTAAAAAAASVSCSLALSIPLLVYQLTMLAVIDAAFNLSALPYKTSMPSVAVAQQARRCSTCLIWQAVNASSDTEYMTCVC